VHIQELSLNDFMVFEKIHVSWSKNINIICGANSTGKTVLLKSMYSLLYAQNQTQKEAKDWQKREFGRKFASVFRPDEEKLGNLVRKGSKSDQASGILAFDGQNNISFSFGKAAKVDMKKVDIQIEASDETNELNRRLPVYIPPKEIISATENFRAIYESYHIAFEETYNDLARLLTLPTKRQIDSEMTKNALEDLEKIVGGEIVAKNNCFYIKKDSEEYEMGLVSEGYRKISTLIYLMLNGSLESGSVLFWDEPESNMNPMLIYTLVQVLMKLAEMGVQIFLSTHNYFILQYFNLAAVYPEYNKAHIDIKFISLFKHEDSQNIEVECGTRVSELTHNKIMEEFDMLYNRETDVLYAGN